MERELTLNQRSALDRGSARVCVFRAVKLLDPSFLFIANFPEGRSIFVSLKFWNFRLGDVVFYTRLQKIGNISEIRTV